MTLPSTSVLPETELVADPTLDAGRAPLSASVEARVARAVIDHIIGAGGLQQLLDNPDIENVH